MSFYDFYASFLLFFLSLLSLAGVMVSDNRYIVGDQFLMAPTTTSTTS
jgi:hypothetical protein